MMPVRVIKEHVGNPKILLSLASLLISIVGLIAYINKIYQGVILQTDDTSF